MAPTSLYTKLSSYVAKPEKKIEPPMISATAAAGLSILYTLLYVLPLYLTPTTRPSPSLSRDAPSSIRSRIRIVSLSVTACSFLTAYLLSTYAFSPPLEVLHQLGLYPLGSYEIFASFLLTALLFAGPLFERGIVDGGWRGWIKGRRLHESLSSWIGWRNYVAAPVTEEILFRSLIISLHLIIIPPGPSPLTLVFTTPLYFGIAHVHHLYEFTLTHPFAGVGQALVRSLMQFGYTTLFGWYASFLVLRTGSVWGVIIVHAFCNWMGLPRVWGKVGGVAIEGGVLGGPVRGKEDQERREGGGGGLGVGWTVAYYLVLIAGAVIWWTALWPLTVSENALVKIWDQSAVR